MAKSDSNFPIPISSSSSSSSFEAELVSVTVSKEIRAFFSQNLKKASPEVHMALQQPHLVQRLMNVSSTITDSLGMALVQLLVQNPDCVVYNIPVEDYGDCWFYLYPLVPSTVEAAVNLMPMFLNNAMESELSDASVCAVVNAPADFKRVLPEVTRVIQKRLYEMLMEDPMLLKGLNTSDCIRNRLHRKQQGAVSAIVRRSPGFPEAASLQTQAGEGGRLTLSLPSTISSSQSSAASSTLSMTIENSAVPSSWQANRPFSSTPPSNANTIHRSRSCSSLGNNLALHSGGLEEEQEQRQQNREAEDIEDE
jgi:hypothetical protein